jgi:CRISPR/Cas system-associated exonuclease Cas4 (RecB family)
MKHQDFTRPFLVKHIGRLVREKAEDLLSCDVTSQETEQELYKVIPMLQMFANRYTTFGKSQVKRQGLPLENYLSTKAPVHFMATEAEAVEEAIVCPELGLKGNIDMIAKAATGMFHPERFMGIELKTSHRQTIRSEHTAQLLLYILMMQTRHGQEIAASSGVLLYLNNEDLRALHIEFDLRNAKDLLSVRNEVAIGQVLAGSSRDDTEPVDTDSTGTGCLKRCVSYFTFTAERLLIHFLFL